MEPLGGPGLLKHEEGKALPSPVAQPFLDRQSVAAGLGNLLAVLVKKELVIEAFRRGTAQHPADPARDRHRVDEILARHFVVDTKGVPAHAPVRLPVELAVSSRDRDLGLRPVLVLEDDRSGGKIALQRWHEQDTSGRRRDRKERRVCLPAFLPQGRQHDRHHVVESLQNPNEGIIESTGTVHLRRAHELVVEAELVEERAEHRVIVFPETCVFRIEGVGGPGQGFAEMACHHLPVRDVLRHLAQAIHVVRIGKEARRDIRQQRESMAHHAGPGDFTEGSDMGQARWSVSGFEQHVALFRGPAAQLPDELACFLERPGLAVAGMLFKRHHDPVSRRRQVRANLFPGGIPCKVLANPNLSMPNMRSGQPLAAGSVAERPRHGLGEAASGPGPAPGEEQPLVLSRFPAGGIWPGVSSAFRMPSQAIMAPGSRPAGGASHRTGSPDRGRPDYGTARRTRSSRGLSGRARRRGHLRVRRCGPTSSPWRHGSV